MDTAPIFGGDMQRDLVARFDQLKRRYQERDVRMHQMFKARKGEINDVFPKMFPAKWPKPLIANIMDVAAHDVSELLSPLPSINCSTGSLTSEAQRNFHDKRGQIAYTYFSHSNMKTAMYAATDRFATYGFMPIIIEPDFETSQPRIRFEDPMGTYPEFNRWGELTAYAKRTTKTVGELCALYPEYASVIRTVRSTLGSNSFLSDNARLELVTWTDVNATTIFLPDRQGFVLQRIANKLDRIPVVCPIRPGTDFDSMKGEFDDILWVWLARARFALLSLESATKAVGAPIAAPPDAQNLAFGTDAVIRTNYPEKVRRVSVEMPQSAFAEQQTLERETRIGARYPESRDGSYNSSIITGAGVEALNGGFDTRIRAYQDVQSEALRNVLEICFEMDEKYWPSKKKTVRGMRNGAAYTVTYTPERDIKGDHSVDVQYGLMAGLDPNRAMVFGLQARGEKLISRDFLMRQMPWELDVVQETRRIDQEQLRDYLMEGIAGTIQALPTLAAQGQDPTTLINQVAKMIDLRSKGKTIEEAASEAFEPQESPPPDEAGPGEPMLPGDAGGAPGGGGAGQLPSGMGPTGRMEGVAPGQQGMGAGGRPDIRTLLAGLSNGGAPNLAANLVRRQPVG